MKFQVVSDLHLEFDPTFRLTNTGSDLLVLSGDICVIDFFKRSPQSPYADLADQFRSFIKDCCEKWPYVLYIAGNHEFYYGCIDTSMQVLMKEFQIGNLWILDNQTITIGDVAIIGSTLWASANKRDPITLHVLESMMNDFRLIKNERLDYRRFSPHQMADLNSVAVDFIEKELAWFSGKKVLICTHHSPSQLSIGEAYKDEFYMNGGYHNYLEDLILANPNIAAWTHGHTHDSFDYNIGNTRVICNPKGYGDQNKSFNPGQIFEI